MTHRILKLSTAYDGFVKKYERKVEDLENKDFKNVRTLFANSYYSWCNWFEENLKKIGHDAWDIPVSLKSHQKQWAKENGIRVTEENWKEKIFIKQAKQYQPNVVFLQDLYYFGYEIRERIREVVTKDPYFIGWRSAPTSDYSSLQDMDLILSSLPHLVKDFNNRSINSEIMYGAFEPKVAELSRDNRDIDFSFIGTLGPDNGKHSDRKYAVRYLMRHTPLEVWTQKEKLNPEEYSKLKHLFYYICNTVTPSRYLEGLSDYIDDYIERLKNYRHRPTRTTLTEEFPEKVHDAVFGRDYYECLGRSKIAFNKHLNIANGFSANMRLFEATGMGACLLTERSKNISNLFDPETEVVTYGSIGEAQQRAKYLLDHPGKRKDIAKNGRRRVVNSHTFRERSKKLIKILDSYM